MLYLSSSEPFRRIRSTALGKPVSALFRVSTADYTFPCRSTVRRRRGRGCLNTLTGGDLTVANTVAAVRREAFDVLVRQFPVGSGEENAISIYKRRGVMKEGSSVCGSSLPVADTAVAGMSSLRGRVGAVQRILCMHLSESACSRGVSLKGYLTLSSLLVYRTRDVPRSTLSKSYQAWQSSGMPPTIVREVKKISSVPGAQHASGRLLNFALARHMPAPLRPTARVNNSEAFPLSLHAGFVDGNADLKYLTDILMNERVRFSLTGAMHTRTREPSGGATSTAVEKWASTVHSASLVFFRGLPDCAASSPRKPLTVDGTSYMPGGRADLPSSSCGLHGHGELLPQSILAGSVLILMSPDEAEKSESCRTAEGSVPLLSNFTGERASRTRSRCSLDFSAQERCVFCGSERYVSGPERQTPFPVESSDHVHTRTRSGCSLDFSAQEYSLFCGGERYVSGPERQTPFPVESSVHVHTNEGFSLKTIWSQNFNRSCGAAYADGNRKIHSRWQKNCFLSLHKSSLPPRNTMLTTAEKLSVPLVNDPSALNEGRFPQPSSVIPVVSTTLDKNHAVRFLYANAPPSVSPCSLSDREDLILTEVRVNVLPDATEKASDTERALDRLVTRVLRHSKHRHHPRHMLHIHHNKHRYRQWFQKPCKTSTGIHLGSKKSGKR